MSDEVKTGSAPIQRNLNDIAMELTQLYFSERNPGTIAQIQDTYKRFYATARNASGISLDEAKRILGE